MQFETINTPKFNILFLEDDPTGVRLVTRAIHAIDRKINIQSVSDKKSFENVLEEGEFDCVVIDYTLPDLNGMDALKIAKVKTPMTPAIIFTGSVGGENAIECFKAGAYDFVLKTNMPQLISAVISACELKRSLVARKIAEEAFAKSENQYHNLFERANDAILIVSPEEEMILEANQRACVTYGYTREELIGMSLSKISSDANRGEQQLKKALNDGLNRNFESRHFKKDGTVLNVLVNTSIVEFNGNKAILSINRDITERKRADETVRLLAHTMESISEITTITDLEDRFTFVNEPFLRIYGYARHEVLGKHVSMLWSPNNPPELLEEIFRESRSGSWKGEILNITKDGREFPISLRTSQVKDEHGIIIGLVGISEDITERRHAQQALIESEERFRTLYENSTIGIYRTTPDGTIVLANPTLLHLLGYSSTKELSSRNLNEDGFEPSYNRQQFLAMMEKEGEVKGLETGWRRKDGGVVYVREYARAIRDAKGTILYYDGTVEDITDRKLAEQSSKQALIALQESQHRFYTLTQISPVGIFRTDPDGSTTYVNPRWCQISGVSAVKALGDGWLQAVYPEDKEIIARNWKEASSSRKTSNAEYRFVRPNGSIVWVMGQAVPEMSVDNEVIGYVGTITDITEHKQAEGSLVRERNLLRLLIDNLPDKVHLKDTGLQYQLNNITHLRSLGLSKQEDTAGKSLTDFFPLSSVQKQVNQDQEVIKSGKALLDCEEQFFDKGKREWSWYLTSRIPVRDHLGKILGLLTISRDISARKQVEETLRMFSRAVEQSGSSIIITNIKGDIEYVNPKFVQISGYTAEEAMGKNPRFLKSGHTKTEEYAALWNTILSGKEWRGEFHNRKKNGELFWESVVISSIKNPEGELTHFVAVKEDISEHKKLEEQVRQMQKLESLGTLASGIAHDFNNILAIIIGHTSLLELTPGLPENIKKKIDTISKGAMRGAMLVKQLLTFARKSDVILESVRLNDSVREVSQLLAETFPKNITIEMNLAERLPSIVADATQVHQVMLNLCVNARDAMPNGGTLTISTRRVPAESVPVQSLNATASEYLALSISDNGFGMDAETRRRIFEPFFTTKDIGKGTGLGLSVVFGIMESHRGFIDVESEVGTGTTFHVYFPLLPIQEFDTVSEETKEEILGGNEQVLIIEDEELLCDLLKAILEGSGYSVLTAMDGEQAMALYKKHRGTIHLVLSDMGLPKQSGYDVFREMKKLNPAIKFILASGYLEPSLKPEIVKEGVKQFVQKPYKTNELLRVVRKVLDEQ